MEQAKNKGLSVTPREIRTSDKRKLSNQFKFSAVLFDLDGTLLDSSYSVERSWFNWALNHGLNGDEILKIAHGRPTIETIKIVAPELDAEIEAKVLERTQAQNNEGVEAFTGAKELLATLPTNCWAVVTSSSNFLATNRIKQANLPFPQKLITADDITNSKPHPEGYLKAASFFNSASSDCLVIEDTPVGVEAGKAAGMKVIAVANTYKIDQLSVADLVIQDLTEIHFTSCSNTHLTISVI